MLISSALSVPEIEMMPQGDGSERVPAKCAGPVMANTMRMKLLYIIVLNICYRVDMIYTSR
jgi:hypothetical protein